jgi:hypothetical protein
MTKKDLIKLSQIMKPTNSYATDEILLPEDIIDYLENQNILDKEIISFHDFDGVHTKPNQNITLRAKENRTENPFTTLDIGYEKGYFDNPQKLLNEYKNDLQTKKIFNKENINEQNIHEINTNLKTNFHKICRFDSNNAQKNYYDVLYTQIINIIQDPHKTPLSKDFVYNFIRMSILTDQIIISTISDHNLINIIAKSINTILPKTIETYNNTQKKINPIKAKGTKFIFNKEGRIPKSEINQRIKTNFSTNKIYEDTNQLFEEIRNKSQNIINKKALEKFDINTPIINKTTNKTILFNSDNFEDQANIYTLSKLNENNTIIYNAIINDKNKQINNIPENAEYHITTKFDQIVHNLVIKKAIISDLYILGKERFKKTLNKLNNIYNNISKKNYHNTESELNDLLYELDPGSSIYNTIKKERDNFIFDRKKTYTQFEPGNKIKSSGYIQPKSKIKQINKIVDNIDLIKTPKTKKIMKSLSQKMGLKKYTIDISKLQIAIAKIITNEDLIEPDLKEYFSKRTENAQQYIR